MEGQVDLIKKESFTNQYAGCGGNNDFPIRPNPGIVSN